MTKNMVAVETSTDFCSVAIYLNGNVLEKNTLLPRQHAHEILVMLESLLSEAELAFSQIDALAFGCGPGSFTGLRIAASVIQGLAVAWDKPVIPISSLHALAQGAYRQFNAKQVFSCLDARMDEVYGGFYVFSPEAQKVQMLCPDFLISPEKVPFPEAFDWFGVGSGCKAYLSIFREQRKLILNEAALDFYPHAYDVVDLAVEAFENGKFVAAEEAVPVYLRNNYV